MELLIILSDDVHVAALRHARALGSGEKLPAHLMNAMLDDEIEVWVRKIWDPVEAALREAFSQSVTAARSYIDEAVRQLNELVSQLGKKAEQVRAIIAARLNEYLKQAIDGALQRVRPTITVGTNELKVASVTIEQKIKLSGSLKASLEEICEFVAEGEITLSAEYGSKP